MNTISRTINVARHFRIPSTSLVAKVSTSLHHLGQSYNSHSFLEVSGSPPPAWDQGIRTKRLYRLNHPKRTGVRDVKDLANLSKRAQISPEIAASL